MSLTILRDDIKRKCMISSANIEYNTAIDKLIEEMRPAIEYSIDPVYLQDTENSDLQALLTLGTMELIAAEFLAQRAREPGYGDEFQIGQLRVGQNWERGKQLAQQGQARLAPYLRPHAVSEQAGSVLSTQAEQPHFSLRMTREA